MLALVLSNNQSENRIHDRRPSPLATSHLLGFLYHCSSAPFELGPIERLLLTGLVLVGFLCLGLMWPLRVLKHKLEATHCRTLSGHRILLKPCLSFCYSCCCCCCGRFRFQFTGADLSAVASNALQLALRLRAAEIGAQVRVRERGTTRSSTHSSLPSFARIDLSCWIGPGPGVPSLAAICQ